jgi:hypothetical protein
VRASLRESNLAFTEEMKKNQVGKEHRLRQELVELWER